ncbi:MAG: right-handed parallel beta-helix repeat-containing protein [Bacteroidales bacterium]
MKKVLQIKVSGLSKRIILGILCLFFMGTMKVSAQVSFTQTTNADFYKGAYNDLIVASDNIYLPYQADDVNTWLTTTVLPQTLEGHKAATWNNRYVYVVGGYNDLSYSNSVYRATLQSSGGISSWTTENSLPVGLRDHAVVIGTNTLYVLGGRNDSQIFNTVYYAPINADGSLGVWETASVTIPLTLWGHTAAYCNGYVYVAGGASVMSASAARNNVYYAKINADNSLSAFNIATNLPSFRNGHSMVTSGDKVYVLGGFTIGGSKQNTVYFATSGNNGALGSWSAATALPIAVSNHSSVIMNGLITVLAGESGGTLSNSIYFADINTSPLIWNLATNVLYDRTKDGAAFATNGWIGYCGGENLSGTPIHNSRYATLSLSSNHKKNGFFVSNPFYELGAERIITELTFAASNPAVSTTQIAYRTAGDDVAWGNWTALASTSPITVGVTDHYLQYKIVFTGDGLVTPTFQEMNLWTPGTELSGNLNALTNITLANSPYWVTADASFTSGTHTFEAGVVWNFLPQTRLTIGQANVICNGTSGNPIQFIGFTNDEGLWDGIYFDPDSDNGVSSQFNYVVIANGGYGNNNANLYCNSSNEPFLNHCTIRNADGNGIRLNNSHINAEFCDIEFNSENGVYLENSNPTFVSCDINNNGAAGVYFTSNTSEPTYSNTTIQNNLYGLHYPSPNYTIYPPNGDPTLLNNTYNGIVFTGGSVTSGNKVWNSVIYDYILLGTVTIELYASTVRLTIEPGNTVKTVNGAQLQVGSPSHGGELYAIGTADSVITFTSYDGTSGGWNGLYFHDYSDAYTTAPSVLDYCVIENGNEYNYYAHNTSHVQINNSIIRDGFVDGARYYNSYGTIQNCDFTNNTRYPLYFTDWQASPEHDMNTMSGNQVDMIVLEGGQFSSDRTFLYDNGLHYLALNDIILGRYAENRTLTIEPGVTIEFQPGTQLQVGLQSHGGNLFAEGTSGSPITFKAFNDTPGGWEGIYFHPYSDVYGSSSSMKYCIIEQGNNYNVYCNETSEPFFENCTFQNSFNDGLRETSTGPSSIAPEVHDCQFLNNGAYPINYLTWDCNSHLEGNTYSGNNPDYIALSGGQYASNRTLYNDGIPYHVLSDIILGTYADHRRLTIEPGVILEFDPSTKLQVGLSSHGGDLYAEGNADSIILFKPYNDLAGGWEGIYFHGYSDVYGSTSSMKYCNIEMGNNYNLYCESTVQPATFENCRLTDAVGDGLKLYDATIGDIKNTSVTDNGGHGIYLDGTSHPVIGNDALYTNNFLAMAHMKFTTTQLIQ